MKELEFLFDQYPEAASIRVQVEELVTTCSTKSPTFYRTLYDIQREHSVRNAFYVSLLGAVLAAGAMLKKTSKAAAKKLTIYVTPDDDGGFSVEFKMPGSLFGRPEAVEPEAEPVTKKPPADVDGELRRPYVSALVGDIESKNLWEKILYYSIDKGQVHLASLALKCGATTEQIRDFLKRRYNGSVVEINFSDGDDTVTVTWSE